MVSAFVVLSFVSIAAAAPSDGQPTPASQPQLQPFMPTAAKPADPKAAKVLAGTWKGTFKHKNDAGTESESTYVVEVGPGLTSLKVSLAQPPLEPESSRTLADLDQFLQPIIDAQQAVWDGTTLQAHIRQDHLQIGKATVDVDKQLSLRLERDSKHALFTYNIQVKSALDGATTTTTMKGSGVLTRPR